MFHTADLPSVFGPHTVDFGSNNQTFIFLTGNIRITLWGQLNGIFEIFYKNLYQKNKNSCMYKLDCLEGIKT